MFRTQISSLLCNGCHSSSVTCLGSLSPVREGCHLVPSLALFLRNTVHSYMKCCHCAAVQRMPWAMLVWAYGCTSAHLGSASHLGPQPQQHSVVYLQLRDSRSATSDDHQRAVTRHSYWGMWFTSATEGHSWCDMQMFWKSVSKEMEGHISQ